MLLGKMALPPVPKNEVERLALLHSYGILDTEPESGLDDIARLASAICDTPIALITLVDRDRQWFKARVGLEIPETSRASSFCAYAIADAHQPLIVHDTWDDARFVDNPLVVGDPNIRFYAGVPLVDDGHALGTLCVIDHAPRVLSAKQLDSLVLLARQAASELGRSKHRRGSERPLTGASSLPRAIDSAVIAGRYRIEDVIGIGGMGIVVGATDLRNERPVAVKFLLPESSHELGLSLFIREAQILMQLDSEHVTRIYDVGNLGTGKPYIVMERLDGEDLDEVIEARAPLSPKTAIDYLSGPRNRSRPRTHARFRSCIEGTDMNKPLESQSAASPTMRATVFHGKGDIRLEAVPLPHPGPGDVVIRSALKPFQPGISARSRVPASGAGGAISPRMRADG